MGPGREDSIGFLLDLTQRNQTEEALRKSEEQFRQLADNIHEIFSMMNPEGTQLLYVNSAYEQIWKLSRESLYKDPGSWLESIHPDDRVAATAMFRRQLAGEHVDNEYRIVLFSGVTRWIRNRAVGDSRQPAKHHSRCGYYRRYHRPETGRAQACPPGLFSTL